MAGFLLYFESFLHSRSMRAGIGAAFRWIAPSFLLFLPRLLDCPFYLLSDS